jgi:hypothetical protein
MKDALSLLTLLICATCMGLIAFAPNPGVAVQNQSPLLLLGADGQEVQAAVPPEQRQAALSSALAGAHPVDGIRLNAIFGNSNSEAEESTPALGEFPALYRPRVLRANIQEGGVRLSWLPHPRNPIDDLEYRIERWNSAGGLDAAYTVTNTELLDRLDCEGITFHYRVYTELERPVPGLENAPVLRRSSPAATTKVALPKKSEWVADKLIGNSTLVLRLKRHNRPELGPFEVEPGENIADSGWILESFTKGETEVPTMTRIPRFDELGRRVIVDDRPAFRGREGTETRKFVTVHLLDPCGSPWRQNLLLPPPARRHNGALPSADSH